MTDERKQEYTRRIAQANRTEVVVITYEIALDYLADARAAADNDSFDESVRKAKKCVEQLRDALDMNYANISVPLANLYNYVTLQMDKAVMKEDQNYLDDCEMVLKSMHETFQEVAKQDTSDPMMANSEMVYSGLTYGKNGANENLSGVNRGMMA